jgi:HAD superfamily hydrolase (TIGR01490 family)
MSNPQPPTPDSQPLLTAAVFDVDRTLLPGTTTERLFIRYLISQGQLGVIQLARTALITGVYLLRVLPKLDPMEAIRRQRMYLAGLPEARVLNLAATCFREEIQPRLSAAGLATLREHQARGHLTVLLSGAPAFLLAPLQAYTGADHLIATHLEVRDGRFTGRITGPWPYGPTKALLMRHFAAEHGIAFADSYCYADHHTDVEVLTLFGRPVVINAKPRMAALAQARQWEQREFR